MLKNAVEKDRCRKSHFRLAIFILGILSWSRLITLTRAVFTFVLICSKQHTHAHAFSLSLSLPFFPRMFALYFWRILFWLVQSQSESERDGKRQGEEKEEERREKASE